MKTTNPIQIDNKEYDRFSLSLIVSGIYDPEGKPDASFVCNLVPTRIDGGVVETAPQSAINIRLGALDQADESTLTAVTAIYSALQTFVTEKGL